MGRLYIAAAVIAATGLASAQGPDDPAVLWDEVSLYRDEWGVPHVYADTVRAMAFAFGYAQAEDHLERMLVAYRAAQGRLAEVFGESHAAADEFAIQMGHWDLARAAYEGADGLTRDLCEGFALGVNSWLIDHHASAPPWAEGVAPTDVLALMHYYLMSHAPFDFQGRYRRPPGTPSANAWAVSPSASADGAAILVMNPHTDYTDVFQWYEGHLVVPGVINVSGATLFGLPVILQGHNEDLGWALAPNEPDFADIYVEPQPQVARNPKSLMNATAAIGSEELYYLRAVAESKPYYVRTSNGVQERRAQRMRTARGPVVAQWGGRLLSYRIGGYGEFGALYQLFRMGQADGLGAFQEALTLHQLPCFHVVYADSDGNVFYLYNAKVGQKAAAPLTFGADGTPQRTSVSVWDGPVSAQDSGFEWGPIIPPNALPYLVNPGAGYVQACGTPPWLVNDSTGMGPSDWPAWFARDSDSYRAKRARQLLGTGPRSFEDHQAMLFDQVAPFAVDAVPYLLGLASENPELVERAHPDLLVGLDMLRDWNNVADTGSTAMTFFHVWWTVFRAHSPFPVGGIEDFYTLLRENSPAVQQHALQAASEAAKLMRNEFQTLNVPWGEVHTIRRGAREVSLGGAMSGEPLFMTSDQYFHDGKWPVTQGPGFAMVVKFGPTPEAVSLVPFGTSENPASPHYDDQLDLMRERRFKLAHFTREAVERHAERALGKRVVLRTRRGLAEVAIQSAWPIEARLGQENVARTVLPPGTALFTPVVSPEVRPAGRSVEMEMRFLIPEALCSASTLPELGVFGYDSAVGWYRAGEQYLDRDTRTFIARATEGRPYAVLGPERLRQADPETTPRMAPIVPKPEDYTPLHLRRPHPGPVASSSPAWIGADPAVPSAETDESEADEPGGRMEVARQLPGGTVPPLVASPAEPSDTPVPYVDMDGPSAFDVDPVPVESFESDADGARESEDVREHMAAVEPPPQEAPMPLPEGGRGGRVMWTSKPLSELRGDRPKTYNTFLLVPENAIASPMLIGTDLSLRPPVPGTVFHVTTQRTVRAQVMVHPEPPGALPDGLAAFSYGFTIECDPSTAEAKVAISMQLEPGVCAPGEMGRLGLYAYTPGGGWEVVRGFRVNPETRSLSALDLSLRTYAVLGPPELLLRTPSS